MTVDAGLLDQLLKGYTKPADLIGDTGLLRQLTVALLERALLVEMNEPSDYARHRTAGRASGNSSATAGPALLRAAPDSATIRLPRDNRFEHRIVAEGQARFTDFDNRIAALYARGLPTQEIQAHLHKICGSDVSQTLIASTTDAMIDAAKKWQDRPLEALYPIMYLDAVTVKCGDSGRIDNKQVYLAIGINVEGIKEVLGLWMFRPDDPNCWLSVVTELQARGVKDILIAYVNGQRDFQDEIKAVFPEAVVQLCIAYMVRRSLGYVSPKNRKPVADDLGRIYRAANAAEAARFLGVFAAKWDASFPAISQLWWRNWLHVAPFFAYPPEIRKVIYATNAIESINKSLRRISGNRDLFPNEDEILKSFHLALRVIAMKRSMSIRDWKSALNRFTILFEGRMSAG